MGVQAHAMLPHLFAGAGQGIEDAYLLGELLGHPQATPDNIEVCHFLSQFKPVCNFHTTFARLSSRSTTSSDARAPRRFQTRRRLLDAYEPD